MNSEVEINENSNKNVKEEVNNFVKNNKIGNKIYAVMLFDTEFNLGISTKQGKWINIGNVYFNNGAEALLFYADTPNPASQIIDAINEEELINKMNDMIVNYQDNKWLQENLYPYL